MAAEKIDVLAVIDGAIEEYTNPRFTDRHGTGPELTKARAAIAELIEAASAVNEELNGPDGVSVATADRLSAALARVGGA